MSDIKGHPGFIVFWGNNSTGKGGAAPEAPVVTPAPATTPAPVKTETK